MAQRAREQSSRLYTTGAALSRCVSPRFRTLRKVIRLTVPQIFKNHAEVTPAEQVAKEIGLPATNEVPNIDLEVVNYHRPALGTFHAKFMIVDRKFAIVQSNNIQDNDNLEMATHLEGPIVDSLYDMSLITWHEALNPPLPLLATVSAEVKVPATYDTTFAQRFLDKLGEFHPSAVVDAVAHEGRLAPHVAGDAHYDDDIANEIKRMQSLLVPEPGQSTMSRITAHLSMSPLSSLHLLDVRANTTNYRCRDRAKARWHSPRMCPRRSNDSVYSTRHTRIFPHSPSEPQALGRGQPLERECASE